jgi:uncharacterized membrane protein
MAIWSGDERFRRGLALELPTWVAEDLIAPEQADALRKRYQLEDLAAEASSRLLLAVYLIGALLIGGGVISFAAANWQALPVALRMGVLLVSLFAAHGLGWYWWRHTGARPLLGHALVTLGTLIFAANIVLISQMFQIQGDWQNVFGVSALGALAMAAATGSGPNFIIAVAASLIWYLGWLLPEQTSHFWYPLALAAAGGIFVWRFHSLAALTATLVAEAIALPFYAGVSADRFAPAVICWGLLSSAYIAAGLFLRARENSAAGWTFLSLGHCLAAVMAYALSFYELADNVADDIGRAPLSPASAWVSLLGLLIVVNLGLWFAAMMASSRRRSNGMVLAALAAMMTGMLTGTDAVIVLAANVYLSVLSGILLWQSIENGRRLPFWAGLLLAALVITSRFFEYDTGLLIKSAVFLACGIGVIVAGVQFEAHLRKREAAG